MLPKAASSNSSNVLPKCRRRQFLLCDVDDHDGMSRGEDFMHRLCRARAQATGGTCTGEHGIGQGKQKVLKAEPGLEALDAMRAVKQALDPQNIFSPGKILPAV
jgi:D-lactate dehydrogenase (cytochrome)